MAFLPKRLCHCRKYNEVYKLLTAVKNYILNCLEECCIVISVLIAKFGLNLVGCFTTAVLKNVQFLWIGKVLTVCFSCLGSLCFYLIRLRNLVCISGGNDPVCLFYSVLVVELCMERWILRHNCGYKRWGSALEFGFRDISLDIAPSSYRLTPWIQE